MNLDRFRLPTDADELAWCHGCQSRMSYLHLNDDGLCEQCRPEVEVEVPDLERIETFTPTI